jgi:hypothetical protein
MNDDLRWLVRLEPIGGQPVPYAEIVTAEHGARAIIDVLVKWDSGAEPRVEVSAERVGP